MIIKTLYTRYFNYILCIVRLKKIVYESDNNNVFANRKKNNLKKNIEFVRGIFFLI